MYKILGCNEIQEKKNIRASIIKDEIFKFRVVTKLFFIYLLHG